MAYRQSENEMKEELITARILSVVFISFMILIVSSYSDISEPESSQILSSQAISIEDAKTTRQAPILINTSLNQTLGSIKIN